MPDTAACDSKYFGLKNQIRNAARFFRAYQDNASGWYKPYWTGNYKVHWHPDLSRCGGVNLNIQNRATASLYSYTPYQPNRAALNAGWGTGDTCSSYGNRNFYNYFTSWFGDTRVNIAKIKTDLPEDKYRLRYLNDTATTVQPKTQNNTIKVDMIAGARKNNNYDCFQLKKVASQIYSLISCANNLAVDVAGGTATDGNNVWQYTQNGTDAQKWYIYDNEDGTYSFATIKDPNLVLTKDGSGNLVLTFYTRSDAQKFRSTQISPKIANGVYNIKSNLDSTKLIDVKSASPLSGANVQLWTKNSSSAQWFNFEFDAQTGYYKISNFFTKKNLDVYGAGNANGTNVQMYNANNTNAQKWQIVESGNGTFNLLSASSGKALDISNGKNQNGSNMQIWVRNKTNAQKWLLQKETRTLDDGLYYIESFTNTHFVLDADNLDRKAGSNIQLATRNDRIDQAFYIKYLPNIGLYKIVNKVSNKSLDVKSAKDTAGTNIQIWNDKEGHEAQLWDIIKNSDGSYSILTVCGGRAVDIKSGIIKSGVNIQTWTRNNTIAQKWLFERAN